MISERAKSGFSQILKDAIKASIVASDDDVCEIEVVKDVNGIEEDELVVLTISSYLFRVMTFFYVKPNKATRAHFARKTNSPTGDMEKGDFYDAFCEYGNICCGAVNRDLGNYFPHVGMSTPNKLDKQCVRYLDTLGYGYIQHFKITINQSVTFYSSLCVCGYADIDFALQAKEDDVSTGELEMF